MDPAPIPCPACARPFRNKRGLGGHLTTVSDPAHESYRAAHGMPVKTPRATRAQARKEAKTLAVPAVASATPAPIRPAPASIGEPRPDSHAPFVQTPAVPNPPLPRPVSPDPPKSALQAAVDDFLRQARDMVKFIPQTPSASDEMKEEVRKIYQEAEQANQELLH